MISKFGLDRETELIVIAVSVCSGTGTFTTRLPRLPSADLK